MSEVVTGFPQTSTGRYTPFDIDQKLNEPVEKAVEGKRAAENEWSQIWTIVDSKPASLDPKRLRHGSATQIPPYRLQFLQGLHD